MSRPPGREPRGSAALHAAGVGCMTGAALTFLYATAFAGFAIVASSVRIARASDPDEFLLTLVENGITLAYLCSVTGMVLSIACAVVGAATAAVIAWVAGRATQRFRRLKTTCAALSVGGIILLALYALISFLFGSRISLHYPETFWFWFGAPGILYLLASMGFGITTSRVAKSETTV